MKSTRRTRKMVEAALLIALSTILSVFKLAELPYGGSITLASMLPMVILSYRHGLSWGLGGGAVYAVLQQLLGLNHLSYFSTWQSVLAIIVLDYMLAFAAVGLGGVFRRPIKTQKWALACGVILVCAIRYTCHVISGATVWAGLSIPTGAALLYSLGYNATYMLPETIVTVLLACYLGALVDFRKEQPTRLVSERALSSKGRPLTAVAWLLALCGVVTDVALIFPHLQNAESGEFDFSGLAVSRFAHSFWMPVAIVSAVCLAGIATVLWVRHRVLQKEAEKRQK